MIVNPTAPTTHRRIAGSHCSSSASVTASEIATARPRSVHHGRRVARAEARRVSAICSRAARAAAALKDELAGPVHALAVKARAPGEA